MDRKRRPLSRKEEEKLWRSYSFSSLTEDFRWKGGKRDCAEDCILASLLTHRAESLFARGESEAALEILERLKEVGKDYKEILQNTGSLLSEKGFFEEAFPFYEASLKLDPTYARARRNYAFALLQWGKDPQKAIEVTERSLKELPPYPSLLKLLGKAYLKARCYRTAREVFLKASRLDPRDPEPLKIAGKITEENLGDKEGALKLYKQSLERLPTQADLIEKVYGPEARKKYEEKARQIIKAMDCLLYTSPSPRD